MYLRGIGILCHLGTRVRKTVLLFLVFAIQSVVIKGKDLCLLQVWLRDRRNFQTMRYKQKKWCLRVPPEEPTPGVTMAPLSSAHAPHLGAAGPPEKAPARGCWEPDSKQVSLHIPAHLHDASRRREGLITVFSPKKQVELEILENSEFRLEPLGTGAAPVAPERWVDVLAMGEKAACTSKHPPAALLASPQNTSLTPGQVYAQVSKNRSFCCRLFAYFNRSSYIKDGNSTKSSDQQQFS